MNIYSCPNCNKKPNPDNLGGISCILPVHEDPPTSKCKLCLEDFSKAPKQNAVHHVYIKAKRNLKDTMLNEGYGILLRSMYQKIQTRNVVDVINLSGSSALQKGLKVGECVDTSIAPPHLCYRTGHR